MDFYSSHNITSDSHLVKLEVFLCTVKVYCLIYDSWNCWQVAILTEQFACCLIMYWTFCWKLYLPLYKGRETNGKIYVTHTNRCISRIVSLDYSRNTSIYRNKYGHCLAQKRLIMAREVDSILSPHYFNKYKAWPLIHN